jgi:DNA repair exonuclease SbcCD ATPase subunit
MRERSKIMSRPEYRISDDMASEVLAEAARLNMEATQGYSVKELEQAGLEVQLSPKIIGQAIKIVEERRQAEQAKRQLARDRLKQQIRKLTSIGFFLGIPVVLAVSMIFLPAEINKVIKLPELQRRIKELENEKQQIQSRLENEKQQLKLKKEEVSQLQQNNDKFIKEIRDLQQEIGKLNNYNTDSRIMFRDEFRETVVGKTEDQVIQAVGKPDRTSDFGGYSHWYYDGKTKDRFTGKLDNSISIFFADEIAEEVSSY